MLTPGSKVSYRVGIDQHYDEGIIINLSRPGRTPQSDRFLIKRLKEGKGVLTKSRKNITFISSAKIIKIV